MGDKNKERSYRREFLKYTSLGAAGIGFSSAAVGNATAETDDETISSTQPPEGGAESIQPPVRATTNSTDDASVLILKDCDPWDAAANEIVLTDDDISYEVTESQALPNVDLSTYSHLVLPSTQDSTYYERLVDNADVLESFVADGGVLVAHVTDSGWPCSTAVDDAYLPRGVTHVTDSYDDIDTSSESHPITDGISDSSLDNWGASAHGYLTNVPSDATVIMGLDGAVSDRPTHIEYEHGDGLVLASKQTLEWPWQSDSGTKAVLRNELEYALEDDAVTYGVEITNARLVQVVENTNATTSNYTDEPDPPLIEGRATAPIFDLEPVWGIVPDESDIPDSVSFRIDVTTSGDTRSLIIELDSESFIEVLAGDRTLLDVFDQEISDDVAVFSLDSDTETVRISNHRTDGIDVDPVVIDLEQEYERVEMPPLRVGFATIEDPDGGDSYGNSDGRATAYEESVEKAVEYLERVYPTPDVKAFRLDEPLTGDVSWNSASSSSFVDDAASANAALEELTQTGPDTIYNDNPSNGLVGGTANGSFVTNDQEIEEFDETVLIVPGDYGNGSYMEFQDRTRSTTRGNHVASQYGNRQPNTSSVVVESGGTAESISPRDVAETVAHELAHHFTQRPYEGPSQEDHPLADVGPDFDHASYDVRSTGYDLESIPSPSLTVERYSDLDGAVKSLMASRDERWPDSRIFTELIESEFEPHPPIGSQAGDAIGELSTHSSDAAESTSSTPPVLDGKASLQEDNSIEIEWAKVTDGAPMAEVDEGTTSFEVIDTDGDVIASRQVSKVTLQSDDENGETVTDEFLFRLPFPSAAAEIRVTHNGTTTSLEPLSTLLRTSIAALPDSAFVNNPDQRRQTLLRRVDPIEKQLSQGRYHSVNRQLTTSLRPTIERVLVEDFSRAANQPSKASVLSAVDYLAAHTDELASQASTNPRTTINGR